MIVTSFRVLDTADGGYTVAVLVQANHGKRDSLLVAGVPVGREIPDLMPIIHEQKSGGTDSSIIVILATDAPLLPHQLKRVAKHISMGLARAGGMGLNSSGEIFLAFSTANKGAGITGKPITAEMLSNEQLDPVFEAAILATEEAVINAIIAGETMVGINGNTSFGMPRDRLREILKKYNRLKE